MSRARHKARGGATKWYDAEGTNAAKEAEDVGEGGDAGVASAKQRRRGGHLHGEGEKSKHRADRRARGGKVEERVHHAVKHHSMHHDVHKPGRKRGGGIGSDRTPLTGAAKVTHVTKGEEAEHGVPSD